MSLSLLSSEDKLVTVLHDHSVWELAEKYFLDVESFRNTFMDVFNLGSLAVKIWVLMYSHQRVWEIKDLAKILRRSRENVYAPLYRLEDHGYIKHLYLPHNGKRHEIPQSGWIIIIPNVRPSEDKLVTVLHDHSAWELAEQYFLDVESFRNTIMDVFKLGKFAVKIYALMFLYRKVWTTADLMGELKVFRQHVSFYLLRLEKHGYVKLVSRNWRAHTWRIIER